MKMERSICADALLDDVLRKKNYAQQIECGICQMRTVIYAFGAIASTARVMFTKFSS